MAKKTFNWYVLKVLSGKELRVKEYIETAARNTDLGKYVQQVLVPTEKILVQRGNKRVQKEVIKMPGYVFVEALVVDQSYPMLRNAPDVLGFLSDTRSAIPSPIRPSELPGLIGLADQNQVEQTEIEVPCEVGDSVRVMDGPFAGFNGRVDEVLREKRKVKLIATIFGRETPIELDFAQVIKE